MHGMVTSKEWRHYRAISQPTTSDAEHWFAALEELHLEPMRLNMVEMHRAAKLLLVRPSLHITSLELTQPAKSGS